jgi:5-oxoprolinase (ATP-hydrolysing)
MNTMTPTATTGEEMFDPVSLEIMWSRLIGTADEMWTTVLRTAVSTIIGAAQDFGCELLDERGNSLAHSYRSMPVFNLIMPELTRKLIEKHPVDLPGRPSCRLRQHRRAHVINRWCTGRSRSSRHA